MQLTKLIQQYIAQLQLCNTGNTLLVAVSGGVDSMVLANLLHKLGYSIALAHCNYQLRGAASDADEALVAALAAQLHVPLHTQKYNTEAYAIEHKVGIQVAARQLRYAFFNTILQPNSNTKYDYIATAHHANDNAETVLMNLCKGTGIDGLHGILPKQGNIIRPMLTINRAAIEAYAHAYNVPYLTDESNATDKYTRNYMRNQVIPLLQVPYPTLISNLTQSIPYYIDAGILLQETIQKKIKKLVTQVGNAYHIPIKKLLLQKGYSTLLYYIIKPYGFTSSQVSEVIKLCAASNSSAIYNNDYTMIKDRARLIITPVVTTNSNHIVIQQYGLQVACPSGVLQIINNYNGNITQDALHAYVPTLLLNYPLILRPWKAGDYMYPLGMPKKKKIARILIDLKLSKPEKEQIWVLQDASEKIVWLVGYKLDDRYKVTLNSGTITQFLWKVATA